MLNLKYTKKLRKFRENYSYKLVGKRLTIAYLVKGVTMQVSGLCLKHRKRNTKYETIKLRVYYNRTYFDILLNVKNTKSTNYLITS